LWPKHGLPIEPKPDEEEVILGQVVMTDFARAQVIDRLLVHERRIESSLYRTMAQLRKEREARTAAEASHSQGNPAIDREVNKVNQVNKVSQVNRVLPPRSKGGLAVDREPAIPAELASFGEIASEEAASDGSDFPRQTSHIALEEKITPHGVTTNGEGCAAQAAAEMLCDQPCETKPIEREVSSVKCQVSSEEGPVSDGGSDFTLHTSNITLREKEKITPYGVTTNGEEPAAQATAETLHDQSAETNPIPGGGAGNPLYSASCAMRPDGPPISMPHGSSLLRLLRGCRPFAGWRKLGDIAVSSVQNWGSVQIPVETASENLV
ncbi:MAG: hypothetical protein ABFE01_24750, partial [Phycisphaerales bacterium]